MRGGVPMPVSSRQTARGSALAISRVGWTEMRRGAYLPLPAVERKQRLGAGTHGVADAGGMRDCGTGRTRRPVLILEPPLSSARDHMIDLSRLMAMVGIQRVRPEQQKADQERMALDRPAGSNEFDVAIVVEKGAPDRFLVVVRVLQPVGYGLDCIQRVRKLSQRSVSRSGNCRGHMAPPRLVPLLCRR